MKAKIKITALITAVFTLCALTSGCAPKTSQQNETFSDNTYAFVSKNIQNNYMQKLYQGFDAACRELDAAAVYKAPVTNEPEEQKAIINEFIEAGVKGIAVAANDAEPLADVLKKAMSEGIKVVSVDSAVTAEARQTHIQQANPENVGRTLMNSAYDLADGNGGIAILSSTKEATNQNLWLEYMKKEAEENPDKYASAPIVEIAYGDDDMIKSTAETQRLLQNPDIKVIIAPTSVGIVAAAEVIREADSDVKLVGLGMPSQMAEYIEDGTCQKMYLWNPIDAGYLAGFALSALDKGQITGAADETFSAGSLGERTVAAGTDGGTEVVLGDLVEFNQSNIGEWKNVF